LIGRLRPEIWEGGESENPDKIQKYGQRLTGRSAFNLNKQSQINAESPRRHGAQILLVSQHTRFFLYQAFHSNIAGRKQYASRAKF
jgi:hypothetical protein